MKRLGKRKVFLLTGKKNGKREKKVGEERDWRG